jgi:hypothetical protein
MNPNLESQPDKHTTGIPTWLRAVEEQVSSLRFGAVQIVVHDGHVVQIERTKRLRLDRKEGDGILVNKPKSPTPGGGQTTRLGSH